jgi:hypothetical protein
MDATGQNYLRAWHVIEALDSYQKPGWGPIYSGIPVGIAIGGINFFYEGENPVLTGLTVGLLCGLAFEIFDDLVSLSTSFDDAKQILSGHKFSVLSSAEVFTLKTLTPRSIWEKLGRHPICPNYMIKAVNQKSIDLLLDLGSKIKLDFNLLFDRCLDVFGIQITINQLIENLEAHNVKILNDFAIHNKLDSLLLACSKYANEHHIII